MTSATPRIRTLDALFAVTLATLFFSYYYPTPFGKLRPFDALSIVILFVAAIEKIPLHVPRRMLPALAFLGVHIVSAMTLGLANGMREAVQVTTATVYVITLVSYLRDRDTRPFLRALGALLLAIVAYAIAWHVAQGSYVGFKRLGDPKTAFLLLPAIVAATLTDPMHRGKVWPWMFATIVFVAIVLSGERKAYIVAAVAFVVMVRTTGRLTWVALVAVVTATLVAVVTADPTGYIARQVDSITNVWLGWDINLVGADNGASLSNMQRAFALNVGMESLRESPWFGVGTNAYVDFMNARFDALPEYLRLGIHGEFLRVLVENGLIGFTIYVTAWLAAARGLLRGRVALRETREGLISSQISTILFVACLAYCTFEASKTLSIIAVLIAPVTHVLVAPAPADYEEESPERSEELSLA